MRSMIENKSVAAYCLALTAKRGFLNDEDYNLRIVCRSLRNINLEILHHLNMPIAKKWPLLIPGKKKQLDYRSMKK